LCEHFHWTPQELDRVALSDVEDFSEVLHRKRQLQEIARKRAEAQQR
jgi:hypothetical protein